MHAMSSGFLSQGWISKHVLAPAEVWSKSKGTWIEDGFVQEVSKYDVLATQSASLAH